MTRTRSFLMRTPGCDRRWRRAERSIREAPHQSEEPYRMRMRCKARTVELLLFIVSGYCGVAIASENHRLELGRTSTGVSVTFTQMRSGWGVDIRGSGLADVSQSEPARIEVSDGAGH